VPQCWVEVAKNGPIHKQRVKAIDFDWGTAAPASDVPPNNFALAATATIELADSTYTLTTLSDDGVRVYFDGQLVIDDWQWHGPTQNSAEVKPKAGKHRVRIEYFERGNTAMLQFGILPTEP
jgi:hypothetical protein